MLNCNYIYTFRNFCALWNSLDSPFNSVCSKNHLALLVYFQEKRKFWWLNRCGGNLPALAMHTDFKLWLSYHYLSYFRTLTYMFRYRHFMSHEKVSKLREEANGGSSTSFAACTECIVERKIVLGGILSWSGSRRQSIYARYISIHPCTNQPRSLTEHVPTRLK